jgi:hypothetical protein
MTAAYQGQLPLVCFVFCHAFYYCYFYYYLHTVTDYSAVSIIYMGAG